MVVPGIVQTSPTRVPEDTVQSRKASAGAREIVRLSATDPKQTAVANMTMARILMGIYPSVLSEGNVRPCGRHAAACPVAVTLLANHIYAICQATLRKILQTDHERKLSACSW